MEGKGRSSGSMISYQLCITKLTPFPPLHIQYEIYTKAALSNWGKSYIRRDEELQVILYTVATVANHYCKAIRLAVRTWSLHI